MATDGQMNRRRPGRKLLLFGMTSMAAVALAWAFTSARGSEDAGSRRSRRNRRARRH
ncbi:MAG: hypothetical protein WCA46_22870 [Actinocatenispora sp.]